MNQDARAVSPHAATPSQAVWLVLLVLVWALYGMTGRDAWQDEEAIALGQIIDWLRNGRLPLDATLYSWTGGLLALILEPFYAWQDGARWASGLFALIAVLFTGLAARNLYGPGFGTPAVLLLMGAFGLLLRVHALLPETALLAGYAVLLYGLAVSRSQANAVWAIAAGGLMLFLTRGLVDLSAALLCALLPLALPGAATRTYRQALIKAGLLLLAALALWFVWLTLDGSLQRWWDGQLHRLGEVNHPGKVFSILAWFAWPAWPTAIWALWHEHRRLRRENPLHLPLAAAVACLPASHFQAYSYDGLAVPMLVPLSLLAAYGIASLRRGAAQAFYWFGVVCFVFFAAAFWIYFAAVEWGWPSNLAARLARMTPGYTPQVATAGVLLAAAATLLWHFAVPFFPRAQARPALVWATGMALVWLLLFTLFRPWSEQSWGWRPLAEAVESHLPADACVRIEAQGPARIMLDYHLADRLPTPGGQCGWRLVLGKRSMSDYSDEPVWEGYRPRYKGQVYRLYRNADASGAL